MKQYAQVKYKNLPLSFSTLTTSSISPFTFATISAGGFHGSRPFAVMRASRVPLSRQTSIEEEGKGRSRMSPTVPARSGGSSATEGGCRHSNVR